MDRDPQREFRARVRADGKLEIILRDGAKKVANKTFATNSVTLERDEDCIWTVNNGASIYVVADAEWVHVVGRRVRGYPLATYWSRQGVPISRHPRRLEKR